MIHRGPLISLGHDPMRWVPEIGGIIFGGPQSKDYHPENAVLCWGPLLMETTMYLHFFTVFRQGADVNIKDIKKKTPIHVADGASACCSGDGVYGLRCRVRLSLPLKAWHPGIDV